MNIMDILFSSKFTVNQEDKELAIKTLKINSINIWNERYNTLPLHSQTRDNPRLHSSTE